MPIPALNLETPPATGNVVDFNSVRRQRALKRAGQTAQAASAATTAQAPGMAVVWPVWNPLAFYAACLMMVTPPQG